MRFVENFVPSNFLLVPTLLERKFPLARLILLHRFSIGDRSISFKTFFLYRLIRIVKRNICFEQMTLRTRFVYGLFKLLWPSAIGLERTILTWKVEKWRTAHNRLIGYVWVDGKFGFHSYWPTIMYRVSTCDFQLLQLERERETRRRRRDLDFASKCEIETALDRKRK